MEHHLQEKIAQLVSEVVQVAARNRVSDFKCFLDGVGRNGRKILLEIPGQPVKGVRSWAMISRSREISRDGVIKRPVVRKRRALCRKSVAQPSKNVAKGKRNPLH